MKDSALKAVAIVGVGAVLPDAPNAPSFWKNVKEGRYSISSVPADRWDPELYYDADPKAPDKTYSKIGGWVKDWEWDPLQWRLPIPPRVSESMDLTQVWAIVAARQALNDYGPTLASLKPDRTAVILGNAMGGDNHLYSAARIFFPEVSTPLQEAPAFSSLPAATRDAIMDQLRQGFGRRMPEINEDTMPGELGNIVAGRVAAVFNFRGPNYVADAACASAMAAISAAVEGLAEGHYDAVLTGGIDANMSPSTFVKFCKIGALSATGTRPYSAGADGFVMGEGAAVFLIRRLADAERDGDRIYAVIRGLGGSSDGKGKGITAPNPIGQRLSIQRAWSNAGTRPAPGDLIEGHGTSTKVGDIVEVESLTEAFRDFDLPASSVALGSVKSNIGHLKGAAGAAGILKAVYSLHERVLPPSLNFDEPNPSIDFLNSPFYVNTRLKPWDREPGVVRRVGVSAFGFGGTNFHTVLEEYIPGRIQSERQTRISVPVLPGRSEPAAGVKTPLRGVLVVGGSSESEISRKLQRLEARAAQGEAPKPAAPDQEAIRSPFRLAIDYGDAQELLDRTQRALHALEAGQPARWKGLRAKGIFLGKGPAPKVAFLFTGQGSQYVNMLAELRDREPIIAETIDTADRVMQPLLGKPLSSFIFLDKNDEEAVREAEEGLKQTAITQPAILAAETALARLLGAYGMEPDMVMGHSLGEYGALVAAGAISFEEALHAVSARGREMTKCSLDDNGLMAAVFGPLEEVEKVVSTLAGYVVIANINSTRQAVIGGATEAVTNAMSRLRDAGFVVRQLQVSHAFHTSIVAPAGEGLMAVLNGMDLQPPRLPVIANVTGDFYPTTPEAMIGMLGRQIASPVQFVKGLHTLHANGARVFVEVGPKRALYGFVDDVLGDHTDVFNLFTNHPRIGEAASVNQALCGLYAAGVGAPTGPGRADDPTEPDVVDIQTPVTGETRREPTLSSPSLAFTPPDRPTEPIQSGSSDDRYLKLGRLFAEFLDRGMQIYGEAGSGSPFTPVPARVTVTGASLALPGVRRVFDDSNVGSMLRGDVFISSVPTRLREEMLSKRITRLIKNQDGGGRFETIERLDDVIQLAARAQDFDLVRDFGFPEDRLAALDRVTQIAIGAGLDALRDAGIPLIMRHKKTTKGTYLPASWALPAQMRDDTGVIFASAFPGYDSLVEIIEKYNEDYVRRSRLEELQNLLDAFQQSSSNDSSAIARTRARIQDLELQIQEAPFQFDRRFLFRVLSMGHSQFAEHIGARGPNTAINAACASGTQAVAHAWDWIRSGQCARVILISADDITSDRLMGWFGAGFLASGAAATDSRVEEAALPFDRRRHGLIVGMGGAALVVESLESARQRGIQPICEVLGTVSANSAFHGTRLDVEHICDVMERLVSQVEAEWDLNRHEMAEQMVFVSHETYTPARGGSASAEVFALRRVFGESADRIVVANTKGATGHPMGVGVEDAVAVKILETGMVPPVPNYKEVDPELGQLNLSRGGAYPVQYALRLGAGFGSQISMTFMRWVPTPTGQRPSPDSLGYAYRISDAKIWEQWLKSVTGYANPEPEIHRRTLRIKDQGPIERTLAVDRGRGTETAVVTPSPSGKVGEEPRADPTATRLPSTTTPEEIRDPVRDTVFKIISEKTGYPPDMLDLDLDLEADLGIDTVKQAEMFSAIREAYEIAREDALQLRDFPTLAHTIQFVYDRRPDLKAPATAQSAPATAPAPTTLPLPRKETVPDPTNPVAARVLAIIAEKTGYPPDMLDLDLDLEADLGIDTVKQAEMFSAIREAYDIPRDDTLQLRDFPTLAHTIQFVYDRRPDLRPETPIAEPTSHAPTLETADEPPVTQDPVLKTVLGIIEEKTGYPRDMLELDLDLEADLGIDTVKQAEMFAAIREAHGIPRDDSLQLRDFPTLAHTLQFVYDRRPDLKKAAGSTRVESFSGVSPQTSGEPGLPMETAEPAASVPRRKPVPLLRPPLDNCKLTGVRLGKSSRVLVMADSGKVSKALVSQLKSLGVTVLICQDRPDSDSFLGRLEKWKKEGPVQGVFWLPALDPEGDLADLPAWREALRVRVKMLYSTMRSFYDQVGTRGSFLVAATRLGGLHGYDDAGCTNPLGGAVTGFTKAFKRERPEALVKAVDFGEGLKPGKIARILIEEAQRDPGAVEIGYQRERRWTIGLEEAETSHEEGLKLGQDTVFVITGAAGSIVSAITSDLAAASSGTFYLLDLTPTPDPGDPDIARFTQDREGLKRDIFERLQATGERSTPARIEKELSLLERTRAALNAIQAVEKAGGRAHYRSVDLLDGETVAAVMREIEEKEGRVDVLLHAAGLEISHFLPDKPPSEFDLVFDVKSDGWFNLVSNLGDMPLGGAVVFSSIAGRFGNGGQTDYSAANDLLCKNIAHLRSSRPGTRGVAIDWTAWDGIGMAARGSIPTVMKQAGITMLPPELGIPVVRRELTSGSGSEEIVIAQSLGVMLEELDEHGGLDVATLSDSGLMTQTVKGMGIYSDLEVATELDPAEQPFLHDHKIGGVAVLPGVMGIEAMVETARLIFPDRSAGVVEEVRFLAPFKFYRDQPRTVTVRASFVADGSDVIANCRLLGSRLLHGQTEPEETTHFTARVRLTPTAIRPRRIDRRLGGPAREDVVASSDIYRLYFHGPAYQVMEGAWLDGDEVIGLFSNQLSENHVPASLTTLASPRLIELCFQAAGLREIAATGRMGLPFEVDSIQLSPGESREGESLYVRVQSGGTRGFDARVLSDSGEVRLSIQGYRTAALPEPVRADLASPLAKLLPRSAR